MPSGPLSLRDGRRPRRIYHIDYARVPHGELHRCGASLIHVERKFARAFVRPPKPQPKSCFGRTGAQDRDR